MLGIFLDTETNGLNAFKHRILQIALKIVDLTSGHVVDVYEATIQQPREAWEMSDKASLKVNGFRYEDIELGIKADVAAAEITNLFQRNNIQRGKAVFICQNPSFDRIFFSQLIDPDVQEGFKWPYYWLDLASMYWAEGMRKGKQDPAHLPWVTGFSKDKIASVYKLPPEKTPHRAMNGVDHLLMCYQKVIGFG
ncbi:MAG: 3'-5' exonuclease [Verrucomicrobia bacterium]|nr:3'-5' exonuclease [Verrucomicrobiota bacterium]